MTETASPGSVVVKIGGGELDDPAFVSTLVQAIKTLWHAGQRVVVVHGGGKTIATYQQALGLETRFLDGLRVTPEESLIVAEMVLSGLLNKRLVRALVAADLHGVGISGVDDGTVRVRPMTHPAGDLGRVGEIVTVDTALVTLLLDQGRIPVISPISLGLADGLHYNVNADHVAMALAAAVCATRLFLVTDVPGVQIAGRPVRAMTAEQAETWIREGHIQDGMIPKVRSAIQAVAQGVAQAVITNLEGVRLGRGTGVLHSAQIQHDKA